MSVRERLLYLSFSLLVGCAVTSASSSGDGGTDAGEYFTTSPCPAEQPGDGSACAALPPGLACEYGGDSWGNCATVALCVNERWSFFSLGGTDGGCGASNCPASFQQAEGSSCSPSGGPTICTYGSEGTCSCSSGGVLSCEAWSEAGEGCSTPRAKVGSVCSTEGRECIYSKCCNLGPTVGPSMVCRHGLWAAKLETCSCPIE